MVRLEIIQRGNQLQATTSSDCICLLPYVSRKKKVQINVSPRSRYEMKELDSSGYSSIGAPHTFWLESIAM